MTPMPRKLLPDVSVLKVLQVMIGSSGAFTGTRKHIFGFDLTVGQLIRVSITFLAAAKDIDGVLHESFPRHKKHATGWLLTAAAAYLTMMLVLVFTGLEEQRQQALNWTLTVFNLLRALAKTLKAVAAILKPTRDKELTVSLTGFTSFTFSR